MRGGSDLLAYYVVTLLNRLSIAYTTKTLYDEVDTIENLIALLYDRESDEEKKERWENVLRRLSELKFQVLLLEEEMKWFRSEVHEGNVVSVPESFAKRYVEVDCELKKITATTINNLDEIFAGAEVFEVFLPKGVSLRRGGRRGGAEEEEVEDVLDF